MPFRALAGPGRCSMTLTSQSCQQLHEGSTLSSYTGSGHCSNPAGTSGSLMRFIREVGTGTCLQAARAPLSTAAAQHAAALSAALFARDCRAEHLKTRGAAAPGLHAAPRCSNSHLEPRWSIVKPVVVLRRLPHAGQPTWRRQAHRAATT